MSLVNKWQNKLQLTDWEFITQEIASDQVVYDNDCPDEDKYFVGIEIDVLKKTGIIYHDREINERDVIHELLHVKYPDKSESWVNEIEELITSIQNSPRLFV